MWCCTIQGVCGKKASTAAIQDLIVHGCHVFGALATALPDEAVKAEWLVVWARACFTTLTNVSFEDKSLHEVAGSVEAIIKAAKGVIPKGHAIL
eukprot:g7416.t1